MPLHHSTCRRASSPRHAERSVERGRAHLRAGEHQREDRHQRSGPSPWDDGHTARYASRTLAGAPASSHLSHAALSPNCREWVSFRKQAMPSVRCVNGLDGAVCSVLEAAGMPTVEHALAFVPSEQRADPRLEQVRPSPTCSHHHARSHRCACSVRIGIRLTGSCTPSMGQRSAVRVHGCRCQP
jgi:hypothetical protein